MTGTSRRGTEGQDDGRQAKDAGAVEVPHGEDGQHGTDTKQGQRAKAERHHAKATADECKSHEAEADDHVQPRCSWIHHRVFHLLC